MINFVAKCGVCGNEYPIEEAGMIIQLKCKCKNMLLFRMGSVITLGFVELRGLNNGEEHPRTFIR